MSAGLLAYRPPLRTTPHWIGEIDRRVSRRRKSC